MQIFLICSVRGASEEEKKEQETYVARLEKNGHKVHWPHRNTNQEDATGLNIIKSNRGAVIDADEIHFWWKQNPDGSSKSEGSVFDFGMVWMVMNFMPDKRIVIANPHMVKAPPHKSYTTVLCELNKGDKK